MPPAGQKRQRPPAVRKGSQAKKARRGSVKVSKPRRHGGAVGAKRRVAGARQARARRVRVTASTAAPKEMGHTAPVEREGGGGDVKGGVGPNKGRAAGSRKLLSKQERKKLRQKRRETPTTAAKAKAMWEILRRHDCEKNQRAKLITDLVEVTRGSVRELIVKHDTARVFQCMLQHGTAEQRSSLFGELEGCLKDLVKLRYAKHLVLKILKHGTPSQRYSVIKSFHGQVCRLVRHKEAADVLETAYNDYATALQRSELLLEFCGPEYAHFKPSEAVSLSGLLEQSPEKRQAVLKYIHGRILSVVDRPSFKHSIVHQVLLDYLTHAGEEDREEMIALVRERLVEILHTKEGARATMKCIWYGRPKDRKVIVKSFKGFVKKICKEEHGYLALLAVFDTVDDTVLVGRALLGELCEEGLEEVSVDPHGSRVLLYLLSPRSPRHFKRSFCALLEGGDGNKYSKKPCGVRCQELLAVVSPPLLQLAKEKVEEWTRDKHLCQLLLETVFSAQGDAFPILESVLKLVQEEFDVEGTHIVSDPVGHFVLKSLVISESKAYESGQERKSFAKMILDSVAVDVLKKWATVNRGAFVLASMVQSKVPQVSSRTAGALAGMLTWLKAGEGKGQLALAKDIERALSSQTAH